VNSKPPTIPFGIVECTFSDNLSRNSCIKHKKVCFTWYQNTEKKAEKEAQPSFLHRLQGVAKPSTALPLLFNYASQLKKVSGNSPLWGCAEDWVGVVSTCIMGTVGLCYRVIITQAARNHGKASSIVHRPSLHSLRRNLNETFPNFHSSYRNLTRAINKIT